MIFQTKSLLSNLNIFSLKENAASIKALLLSILPKTFLQELKNLESEKAIELFQKSIPFFYYTQPKTTPSSITVVVIAKKRERFNNTSLLTYYLRNFLIIGKKLPFLAQRNLEFSLSENGPSFILQELTFRVEFKKELHQVLKRMPLAIAHLKTAAQKNLTSSYLLEGPLFDRNARLLTIFEYLYYLQNKKLFSTDNLSLHFNRFLLHLPLEYLSVRKSRHICHIFSSHLFFTKKIKRDLYTMPYLHHIKTKILPHTLQFSVGIRHVLGIVVTLNLKNEKELFNDSNLLKAIETLLPNIRKVKDSFISYQDESILNVYIEIEKYSGKQFTRDEIKHLNTHLSYELNDHIEELLQAVFKPRNEEEIYHHVIKLSKLLNSSKDLPKAILLFDEQQNNYLRFVCILVRPILLDDPSLSSQLTELQNFGIHFTQTKITGSLDNAYVKEASIFHIHLKKHPFLRKNYSIDLQKAYIRILQELQKYLGPIDELSKKQQEKKQRLLRDLQKELTKLSKTEEFLLENFFYSLWQNNNEWYNLHYLKKLFQLFLTAQKETILYKQSHSFFVKSDEQALSIIIAAEDKECGDEIYDYLNTIQIDTQSLLTTCVSYQGMQYFGFMYHTFDIKKRTLCQEAIKQGLFSWIQKQQKHQIVNLPLPNKSQPLLDPKIGYDLESGIIMRMLYEGLMRFSKNGELEYGVARKVEVSEDYKTYRFFLRDCYWSNDVPIVALDFKMAWQKMIDPSFNTMFAYLFFIIKNAKNAHENQCSLDSIGIIVESEKTLRVELEHPSFTFLELVSHWATFPMNSKAITDPNWSKNAGDAHVSNGPFKLSSWKVNQEIELVKNPYYWDAKVVQLQKIHLHFIDNLKKEIEMFENKELDWAGKPFFSLPIDKKLEYKNKKILQIPQGNSTSSLMLNCENFPFTNIDFRKALAHAIDRKLLLKKINCEDNFPATSILAPLMQQASPHFFKYDLDLAKKYLHKALKELKLTKQKIPPLKIQFYNIENWKLIVSEIITQFKQHLMIGKTWLAGSLMMLQAVKKHHRSN
ncbi:MAG: Oligopeptide-binding protein OppA [Chlamydiae bacterium]|nr:Oligopeptide-binding protein OppA [Chlamydiota bacterium]